MSTNTAILTILIMVSIDIVLHLLMLIADHPLPMPHRRAEEEMVKNKDVSLGYLLPPLDHRLVDKVYAKREQARVRALLTKMTHMSEDEGIYD